MRGRGKERGREKIPGRLHAVSTEPNVGLDLTNHEIMTRAETKSHMLNQLSHLGAPVRCVLDNPIDSVHLNCCAK